MGSQDQDTGVLGRRLRRNSESLVVTVQRQSSGALVALAGIWGRALASSIILFYIFL